LSVEDRYAQPTPARYVGHAGQQPNGPRWFAPYGCSVHPLLSAPPFLFLSPFFSPPPLPPPPLPTLVSQHMVRDVRRASMNHASIRNPAEVANRLRRAQLIRSVPTIAMMPELHYTSLDTLAPAPDPPQHAQSRHYDSVTSNQPRRWMRCILCAHPVPATAPGWRNPASLPRASRSDVSINDGRHCVRPSRPTSHWTRAGTIVDTILVVHSDDRSCRSRTGFHSYGRYSATAASPAPCQSRHSSLHCCHKPHHRSRLRAHFACPVGKSGTRAFGVLSLLYRLHS